MRGFVKHGDRFRRTMAHACIIYKRGKSFIHTGTQKKLKNHVVGTELTSGRLHPPLVTLMDLCPISSPPTKVPVSERPIRCYHLAVMWNITLTGRLLKVKKSAVNGQITLFFSFNFSDRQRSTINL